MLRNFPDLKTVILKVQASSYIKESYLYLI